MKQIRLQNLIVISMFLLLTGLAVLAKDSKVRIHVRPDEASIFVDGVLFGDSSRNIKVAPGKHNIGVYNYGYVPEVREVTLEPGKNPGIEFNLVAVAGTTTGPWGRIQIEGAYSKRLCFVEDRSPRRPAVKRAINASLRRAHINLVGIGRINLDRRYSSADIYPGSRGLTERNRIRPHSLSAVDP